MIAISAVSIASPYLRPLETSVSPLTFSLHGE